MTKKKWKILIIDDDLTMIRTLEKMLVNNACDVISASDGESGYQKAKAHVPEAILLDLMLPDVGGQDVVRKLKADPATKNIPVVFVTVTLGVENDRGNEEITVDGEAYRIFAKPIHQAKLWSVVRKTVNKAING